MQATVMITVIGDQTGALLSAYGDETTHSVRL